MASASAVFGSDRTQQQNFVVERYGLRCGLWCCYGWRGTRIRGNLVLICFAGILVMILFEGSLVLVLFLGRFVRF